MAIPIGQALGGLGGFQTEGLHDTGSFNYRPAQIEEEKASPSTLHQIFDQVLGTAAPIAQVWDKNKQEEAEGVAQTKRAEFDMGKITQNDFNDWMNKGQAWYQDNFYARNVAKRDLGLQARHEADTAFHDNIAKNQWKSHEELDQGLKDARQQSVKTYAEKFQIDEADPEFLRGIGNGLEESDIAIHEGYNKWKSQETETATQNVATANMNGIITDGSVVNPAEKISNVIIKQNEYFKNGVFYSNEQRTKVIKDTAAQLSAQPNGGVLVSQYGEQEMPLGPNGEMMKVKDILGPTDFQVHVANGDASATRLDAKTTTDMTTELAAINADPDVDGRETKRLAFEKKYAAYISPNGETTDWSNRLAASRAGDEADKQAILKKTQTDTAKLKVDTFGRQLMFDRIQQHMKDGTPFLYEQETWDKDSAGDQKEAYVWGVNMAYDNIMNDKNLSDQEKSRRVLKLADADRTNYHSVMGTKLDDTMGRASNEWDTMVMNNDPNAEHPRFNELYQLYQSDPNTVRRLYGDNKNASKMFSKFDQMKDNLMAPADMIRAEHYNANLTPEQTKLRDQTAQSNFATPDFQGVPPSIAHGMQENYNLWFGATGGNTQIATQHATQFAKQNTIYFYGEDGNTSHPHGGISAHFLQVGDDTTSVDVAKSVLEDFMDKNGGKDDYVVEEGPDDSVVLTGITSTNRHVISRGDLIKMVADKRKADADTFAAGQKAKQEAANAELEENNKRKDRASEDAKVLHDTPVLAMPHTIPQSTNPFGFKVNQ